MREQDRIYHGERARQCLEMAGRAADPDIRRRHQELAALHAAKLGDAAADTAMLMNLPVA